MIQSRASRDFLTACSGHRADEVKQTNMQNGFAKLLTRSKRRCRLHKPAICLCDNLASAAACSAAAGSHRLRRIVSAKCDYPLIVYRVLMPTGSVVAPPPRASQQSQPGCTVVLSGSLALAPLIRPRILLSAFAFHL